jgi:AAA domain
MENNSEPVDRTRYTKMTKEERLQAFKRTIAHPHLATADKALREAIQEPGGASIVNVFGPARVGKSTMKNHVIRAVILELLPLLQQDRERVPLLSLMPRPPLSGYFNWKDFFQDGLVAFDEPLIDHKIAFDTEDDEGQSVESWSKRKPPEGTKDALRQSFETAAKRRRSVAIFIDEAQHLGKVSSERQLQNQLDCIKSLAENTGTIIVLIGTYQLLPLRNLSAQLIGRSLDIHFPRYRSTKKELSQFKNVLRTFQDALPFVAETDILLKHWEFCYERSIGCVGNLRLMLVRAVHAALWADAKTLSWKHLETHAFSEAESFEMMREAYDGERELASKPDQHAKLRKMLGLAPNITSKTAPQTDVPQTGETGSEVQTTQQSQAEEIAEEFGQGLRPAEFPADEASSTLQPASDNQSNETTNRPEEGSEAKETPSAVAPPKPLKKPKAETARPFRRKANRDRTGGFRKENKGRD